MYTCGQTPNSGTFTWQTPPLRLFSFGSSPILYRSPIYDKFCGADIVPITKVCDTVSGFQNIYINIVTNQTLDGSTTPFSPVYTFHDIKLSKIYEDSEREIFISDNQHYDLPQTGYMNITHHLSTITSYPENGFCQGYQTIEYTPECNIYDIFNPKSYDFRLIAICCSGDHFLPGIKAYGLYVNDFNFEMADGAILNQSTLSYLGGFSLSCSSSGISVFDRTFNINLFSSIGGWNYFGQHCISILGTSGIYVM